MSSTETTRAAGPILVPVDFSPSSLAALEYAARLGPALGAALHVLHVVNDPASAPGSYGATDAEGRLRPLEDAAAQMLADFLERAAARSPAVAALGPIATTRVTGLVPTRILEVAEKLGAQQIVMGSLGRTGLDRLLVGSKAQRVVQLAEIPVTIVKLPRSSGASADSDAAGESRAKPDA